MRKVLIVCSGGMSSSIVLQALEKAAQDDGYDMEVKAVGVGEVEDECKNGYDILLVAPQVRHKFDLFKTYADEVNLPIILIEPRGYTPLGGKIVLGQVKSTLGD